MKKRLLSLLLVLAVVFSFSLSAFATDTGIDIIDDPLSYYFENQMLGVQKGTGVTLVCPKCDYKVVYTGGTLVTCPHDGEALVLSDLAGVHAEKFTPGGGSTSGGGIGRKDLPGFEDEKGTAQVSKEGKLTYVVHPRLHINDGSLSVPYQNFYLDGEYHSDTCKQTGNHTSSCWHTQISFNYNQYNYDYICVDALRHTKTRAVMMLFWEVQNAVPGTYYVAQGQPLFRRRKSLGADEEIFCTPKKVTLKLPSESDAYDKYGLSRYLACSLNGIPTLALIHISEPTRPY